MAGSLPGADDPPRPHSPHEWHGYEDYRNVHARRIARLEQFGVVRWERIVFEEVVDRLGALVAVNVRDRLRCQRDVLIEVDKWLDTRRRRDGRYEVRGRHYAYHAWQQRRETIDRELIRYDGARAGTPGEPLHVHRFHPDGSAPKEEVPVEELPNLDQFIELACRLAGHDET